MTANFVVASDPDHSAAVEAHGAVIIGLDMPATWTPANVSFEVSESSATGYKPIYLDDGTLYQVAVSTSGLYLVETLALIAMSAYPFFRLKSSVSQAVDTAVKIMSRRF